MIVRRLAAVVLCLALAAPARASMCAAIGISQSPTSSGSFLATRRVPSGAFGPSLPVTDEPVAAAVSTDSKLAAFVTDDGTLRLMPTSGVPIGWSAPAGVAGAGVLLTFGPGNLTIVLAQGNHIAVFSTATGTRLRDRSFADPIHGLALHQGWRTASAPGPGGTVTYGAEVVIHNARGLTFYDPDADALHDTLPVADGSALSIDGTGMAWFVTLNGRLTGVNLQTGVATLWSGVNVKAPIATSENGERVAFMSDDPRTTLIWSTSQRAVVARITHARDVTAMLLPEHDTVLAALAGPMGTVNQVNIVTHWSGTLGTWDTSCLAGSWVSETDDGAHDLIDAAVSSRASQDSVDALRSRVDTNLDAKVSSRASQSSVDALATSVASRASQSSVDSLATSVALRASQSSVDSLTTSVATRASQSSVDSLSADVATRASQSSVDSLAGDVATRASQSSVSSLAGDVATRASQASVVALATDVATRAAQSSLDALAASEQARADADAAEHAEILARLGGSGRRDIEMSLAAGVLQPLFMIPAGPDMDPAALGLTCGGLPAAGAPAIDEDGLFETVRCVTRRALDGLRAAGEDVSRAERDFAAAEADRMALPPRYREAAESYSQALQTAMRGR